MAFPNISNQVDFPALEKEILALRKDILKLVDLEQIKRETIGTTKDFEKNLQSS